MSTFPLIDSFAKNWAYPASGVLALVWLIGAYALVFGVVMVILAFRLRGLPGRLEMHAGTT
jgi:uncharacterized membrane protein HdeD (DUF308 family)